LTQNWVLVEAFLLFAGAIGKGWWGDAADDIGRAPRLRLCFATLKAIGCFEALDRPRRVDCPRVRVDSNIPRRRGEERRRMVIIPPTN
jgi:hypothetical protein